MVYTLTKDYKGRTFKLGSTWTFHFTRKAGTSIATATAIDITDDTTRTMFRECDEYGDVILTIENADVVNGGAAGTLEFVVSAENSALFTPGVWVYFDIESTAVSGVVWQSDTFRFKPIQEVTRDE